MYAFVSGLYFDNCVVYWGQVSDELRAVVHFFLGFVDGDLAPFTECEQSCLVCGCVVLISCWGVAADGMAEKVVFLRGILECVFPEFGCEIRFF